jgi:hypothetical protein
MDITQEQLRRHRLAQSGLLSPFATPEDCARNLVGIQAQITQAAALAIANRVRGFSYAQYKRLLYDERSLVRTWGQRKTVHVYESADWGNITDLMRVRYSWAHSGYIKEGGTEAEFEAFVAKLVQFLSSGRTYSRDAISDHIGVKLSSWGGFMIDAAFRGLLCDSGGNQFAHGSGWNPAAGIATSEIPEARRNLVRRYLHTYGPASHSDIAKWLDESAEEVKAALWDLDTVPVSCEGKRLLLLRSDLDTLKANTEPHDDLPVLLLYRFDPLLLAYKDKNWIVPAIHQKKVWAIAGHVNGVVLINGMARGTWKYVRKGGRFQIETEPFTGRGLGTVARKTIARHEKFLAEFFRDGDDE